MKNILITGISGYIAPYLAKALVINGGSKVTGVYNSQNIEIDGVNTLKCDISHSAAIEKVFKSVKPDIVYHLASVTPTRIYGQNDKFIEDFNCGVTAHIAKLCKSAGALMIYTSTDLVYKEGTNLEEYSSPLEPLTIYARTKLMGENAVIDSGTNYQIMRTSLVYGFTLSEYTSYFDVAYSALKSGKEVNAFTDQFRNPIYTEDAAEILLMLPSLYNENEIINLCGREYLSRYQMCFKMAEAFGFKKSLVKESSCVNFPNYTAIGSIGLDNSRLIQHGLTTHTYDQNLERSKKNCPS